MLCAKQAGLSAHDGRPGWKDPSGLDRSDDLPDVLREVSPGHEARVRIRAVRANDEPRLRALYARLSPQTRYRRFLSTSRSLAPRLAHRLANVDYSCRLALVAEHSAGGEAVLIGVARYEAVAAGPRRSRWSWKTRGNETAWAPFS
jgi:hypothetical protein